MKIKQAVLALILFSFVCSVSAQTEHSFSDFFEVDTILSFLNEESSSSSPICSAQWKDELIVTNYNSRKHSDSVVLYCINMSNYQIDTIRLVEPGLCQPYIDGFSSIAYNYKYLVLVLGEKYCYVYQRKSNQMSKYDEQVLPEMYDRTKFMDDSTLVMSGCYYPNDKPVKLATYNILSKKILYETIPAYNNLLFSFLNRISCSYMDVCSNRILWANRNEYKFLIYNDSLKCIDSISCLIKGWRGLPKSLSAKIKKKFDRHDAICIIDYMDRRNYFFNTYHLSWSYFFDTNKILLAYKPADNHKFVYPVMDVWIRDNSGWHRSISHISDGTFGGTRNPLTRKTLQFDFLSGGRIVHGYPHKFAVIIKNASVRAPIGLTPYGYTLESEQYLAKHNTFMQIVIYKHSL